MHSQTFADIFFNKDNKIFISQNSIFSYTSYLNYLCSLDSGKSWFSLNKSGYSFLLNNNEIWIGSSNGAILSIDDGVNWIDIKKKVCSAGCDRHFDSENILLEQGSKQEDLWGGGIDLETMTIDCNSMINIRPKQNNKSKKR